MKKCNTEDCDVKTLIEKMREEFLSVLKVYSKGDIVSMRDAMKSTMETIDLQYGVHRTIDRVTTGFPELDELTGGFHQSELIVIAACPGMGKTSFALNIAEHIASHEKKGVGIFSPEMSLKRISMRFISSISGVDATAMRKGFLVPEDWPLISKAIEKLINLPIYIVDTPDIKSVDVRDYSKYMCKVYGIECVIVDYPKISRTGGAKLVEDMKKLADALNIPVIILLKLPQTLEKRKDKRPVLDDLRCYGYIERHLDTVIFLHREDYYKGLPDIDKEQSDSDNESSGSVKTEIIVAKQRNYETGTVNLTFHKYYTRFESFTEKK
jgi:replicative DNA helicase